MEEITQLLTRITSALEEANTLTKQWIALNQQWREENSKSTERHFRKDQDWIQWQKDDKEMERDFIAEQNRKTRDHNEALAKAHGIYAVHVVHHVNSLEQLKYGQSNEEHQRESSPWESYDPDDFESDKDED